MEPRGCTEVVHLPAGSAGAAAGEARRVGEPAPELVSAELVWALRKALLIRLITVTAEMTAYGGTQQYKHNIASTKEWRMHTEDPPATQPARAHLQLAPRVELPQALHRLLPVHHGRDALAVLQGTSGWGRRARHSRRSRAP